MDQEEVTRVLVFMDDRKKLLDLFTREIDKQFSKFTDKITVRSFDNIKNRSFDFEVFVEDIRTGVSGVNIVYEFFDDCGPDGADVICNSLLQGYVKYLESAFEGKRLLSEDLEVVKRG